MCRFSNTFSQRVVENQLLWKILSVIFFLNFRQWRIATDLDKFVGDFLLPKIFQNVSRKTKKKTKKLSQSRRSRSTFQNNLAISLVCRQLANACVILTT